jgi:hypothetical protein
MKLIKFNHSQRATLDRSESFKCENIRIRRIIDRFFTHSMKSPLMFALPHQNPCDIYNGLMITMMMMTSPLNKFHQKSHPSFPKEDAGQDIIPNSPSGSAAETSLESA